MAEPLWLKMLQASGRSRSEMERIGEPGGALFVPGMTPADQGGVPTQAAPTGANPETDTRLALDQLAGILGAIWRRGDIYTLPFLVGVAPVRLRPAEKRSYMFIQNQSAATRLILGINQPPGAVGNIPANGLLIDFNLGFYEPLVVPQGEIWIAGGAAATPGLLIYAA